MPVFTEQKAVIVRPEDNVATALAYLEMGEKLALTTGDRLFRVELASPIHSGHKFSLYLIKAGSPVVKYGETIGTATQDIAPGRHVHVHNVVSTRGRGDLEGTDR
jgi:altronate dehydratase small subunit